MAGYPFVALSQPLAFSLGYVPTHQTSLNFAKLLTTTYCFLCFPFTTQARIFVFISDYSSVSTVSQVVPETVMDASTCSATPHRLRPILVIREKAFLKWLGEAQPGNRITYHVGHLATDRVHGLSQLSEARCRELGRIADRAMESVLQGRLHLVQERRGKDVTAYLAVMGSAS
jgi:hypothetical protein